jgi:hypothetical protein
MSESITNPPRGQLKRFKGTFRCPVCKGAEDDPRGQGVRCFGYMSDGLIFCTNVDYGGNCVFVTSAEAFRHNARGPCPCGVEHAPADKPKNGKIGEIDRVYKYLDENGKLAFETVRYKNPKSFRQRRPGPRGKPIWNLAGVKLIPYQLPEIVSADPKRIVWICEGEADADRLRSEGEIATTAPMGAGKWRDEYSHWFKGRICRLTEDNDVKGREHCQQAARSLQGNASSVAIVRFPELPEKGDVRDFFDRGGTLAQLIARADDSPEWTPSTIGPPNGPGSLRRDGPPSANGHVDGTTRDDRFALSNCDRVENPDGKLELTPRSSADVATHLRENTGGWPKRVGEALFLQSPDYEPIYLQSSTRLFAYCDSVAKVYWAKGPDMSTQERFYEYVRMFGDDRFDVIETMPHWPPMGGTYYMHPEIRKNASGVLLDRLLDFFSPETAVDRELIRALIMTPFWGGPPGMRPAFRIEGPSDDPPDLGGRGTGKSTLIRVIASLPGGYIDLEEGEDFPSFKTRLLSNEEGRKRIVRVDNLKTLRLSWAPLEAFITDPVISGHGLYRGEVQRPNTMTVALTVNGGGLSKDMAQRTITIRLARPAFRGDWFEEVHAFIERHRWDIIGEVIATLVLDPGMLTTCSRWSSWERDVLSKCPHFDECQKTIDSRRELTDADDDDAYEIEQLFREKLLDRKHNPDAQNINIPTAQAAAWYSEHHGKKLDPAAATWWLKTKPLKRLKHVRTKFSRFWLWLATDGGSENDPVDLNSEWRPPDTY